MKFDNIILDSGRGCIDQWTCPKCKQLYQCDGGKAGKEIDGIIYIWGPCCCGKSRCEKCGYDLWKTFQIFQKEVEEELDEAILTYNV